MIYNFFFFRLLQFYFTALTRHRCQITVSCNSHLICCFLSPQVCCCAHRMHEKQGVGQVFPRAPRISEALLAPGLLPAQASAENPQVPSTIACMSFLSSPKRARAHTHTHNVIQTVSLYPEKCESSHNYYYYFNLFQCECMSTVK